MKILHNQSQLKRVLFLGIGYVIIGFGSLFTTASQYLVGLCGLGLVYIIQYFYTKNRVLVELTPELIVFNGLLKRKQFAWMKLLLIHISLAIIRSLQKIRL